MRGYVPSMRPAVRNRPRQFDVDRSAGPGGRPPIGGELSKPSAVRPEGKELLAHGVHAEGIAVRVEDHRSGGFVLDPHIEKDRAPRELPPTGAPAGGGRARIEVRELTKVSTEPIDAEQLAGVPRILVQRVGRRAEDDVNAVAERDRERRVRSIEIRELQKARTFL